MRFFQTLNVYFLLIALLFTNCYGSYHKSIKNKFELLQENEDKAFGFPVKTGGYYLAKYKDNDYPADSMCSLIIFKTHNFFVYNTLRNSNFNYLIGSIKDYVNNNFTKQKRSIDYGTNYGGFTLEKDKKNMIFYRTNGNDSKYITKRKSNFSIENNGNIIKVFDCEYEVEYFKYDCNVTYQYYSFDTTNCD
jgi:hypothetical protein